MNNPYITQAIKELLPKFFTPEQLTAEELIKYHDEHKTFLDAVQIQADFDSGGTHLIKFLEETDFFCIDINCTDWKNSAYKEAEDGCVWNMDNLIKYGMPKFSLETIGLFTFHVWIECNGMHYDATCPEGVDAWYKLPIIKESLKTK